MPCRDGGPELDEQHGSQPWQLRNKLVLATRVACSILTYLEDRCEWSDEYLRQVVNEETADWWIAHKVADAQRIEALKASAKAKLTPEEREVLGL